MQSDPTLANVVQHGQTPGPENGGFRQRLVRTLIEDIIADIDEETGEIAHTPSTIGRRFMKRFIERDTMGGGNAVIQ